MTGLAYYREEPIAGERHEARSESVISHYHSAEDHEEMVTPKLDSILLPLPVSLIPLQLILADLN